MGYILLTLLFVLVGASALFFTATGKSPKQDLPRLIEEWKAIEDVKRLIQYYEIATLQSPTPSQLEQNLEDYELTLININLPSTTPSDSLPSALPSALGSVKKKKPLTADEIKVDINRDVVMCGMAKRLIYHQALPSVTPSTATTPSVINSTPSSVEALIQAARAAYCQ